jgi:hypothetical protein
MMVAPENKGSVLIRDLEFKSIPSSNTVNIPVSSIAGNKVQDSERLRIQEHSFFQYWHHT